MSLIDFNKKLNFLTYKKTIKNSIDYKYFDSFGIKTLYSIDKKA